MGKPLKLLVVDDDAPIRRSLARILRTKNFEVELAEDGEAAILLAERFQPDCLLIDIRLPGINGVETFAAIRRILPAVPAVFMTAYAVSEQALAAHTLGAVAVLAKPLDVSDLSELIETCRQAAPVLIVDDDHDLLMSLGRALRTAGLRIQTASTIHEALINVRQRPDRVVVADVFLNDGFGYELLREMASHKVASVPNFVSPVRRSDRQDSGDAQPAEVGENPISQQREQYSMVLVTGKFEWLKQPVPEPLRDCRLSCLSKPLNVEQLIGKIQSFQPSQTPE